MTVPWIRGRILIVHFGRSTGHDPDYVASLIDALAVFHPTTAIRFWKDERRQTRALGYLHEFGILARFALRGGGVVVCQSPAFMDFIAFVLAVALTGWRHRMVGLFVFRRDGGMPSGGQHWKSRLLATLIPLLLRRGRLYPISDSRPVLEHWSPRGSGALVPIPPPGAGSSVRGRPTGGIVVGLLGVIRSEKGAGHYAAVIQEALAFASDAEVVVQTTAAEPAARTVADEMTARWAADPRVRMVAGHVPPEAYVALVAAIDVAVFPYDLSSYGGGTSGVMHDALALHRVVLATPIQWAREQFAGHPDVVWLDGLDADAIARGLRQAVERAMVLRAEDPEGTPAPSTFAQAWRDAVLSAAATLRER